MQTKPHKPLEDLLPEHISPVLRVYHEFNQLKLLYRQGWLKSGIPPERCETVAEHTLGVAVLAMWLADQYFPALDSQKLLRMALLHDFGEIYAGDITPADGVIAEDKRQQETEAVQSIFSKLSQGEAYISCWQEFEAGRTPEARFIRQIDRLEMALQASIYRQQGLATPEEFMVSARKAIHDPELLELLVEIETMK